MQPDIDKIETYLSGDMAGSERQAFEAEIAADPALAEEVDLCRLAREAVELSISETLRNQFQEWQEAEADAVNPEKAKVVKLAPRHTLRRVLAIAAGILLLLVAGSFWYANDQYGAADVAMSYYEASPISTVRSGNSNNQPLTEAVNAIQSGEYAAADEYLEKVPPTDANYADARYYLAHSLYRQNRSADAVNVLQVLKNTDNINLKESAEWLTVLSYLQMAETDDIDFQELLAAMVVDPDHSYHQQAVELDQKLDSFWYQLAN